MRYRLRVLTTSAIVIGLAATGCTRVGNSAPIDPTKDSNKAPVLLDFNGNYKGPAPAVPGARKGGNITFMIDGMSEHLAPQQIYVSDALGTSTNLYHRMLTSYLEPTKSGDPIRVVGDLATNAGETSDGGKTWKYTLRDGIKFEDGTPITSKDIGYGLAISMGVDGQQGPQYIQNALDPQRVFKGESQADLPPGVTTPDDKTLIISFNTPQPAFPYWATYPVTTPVPKAKYNPLKYETNFVASGPYKVKEIRPDQYMMLERNPYWDPASDPIRHQYPDTIKIDYTSDRTGQTERMIASAGDDAAGIMSSSVAQQSIPIVSSDPELKKRVLQGPTAYAGYININTARVSDVDVRRALNYAFDRDAAIKQGGGTEVALPSTTILAPVVPGFKEYNAYPSGPNGDIAKAKKLLAGKKVPKLSYCFMNTTDGQRSAAILQASLQRDNAFQIVLNPIEHNSYYTTIGTFPNSCDLMSSGWGQDWPDGDSTLGVIMNGTQIAPSGNQNYSYFNAPDINTQLQALRLMPDRTAAAPLYGTLDEKIMTDFAPLIPTAYSRAYSLIGTKVGGAFLSPLYAQANLTQIYVKA